MITEQQPIVKASFNVANGKDEFFVLKDKVKLEKTTILKNTETMETFDINKGIERSPSDTNQVQLFDNE